MRVDVTPSAQPDSITQGSGSPTGIDGELVEWLQELGSSGGSDLHLKAGSPPMIRQTGQLRRLERNVLTAQELEDLADALVPARRRALFDEDGEVDFAHSVAGVGRYRANVFRQRGSVGMVFRQLRMGGPSFEEAGLLPIVQQLADEVRGLILVTGPTGSGKTTTLSAMIEHINATRPVHVVTIEDPIEVLYTDKLAAINQREVGQDSKTFVSALRAALRQDPDVILVGEMRDQETVKAALQAAETGHLVLSTLHTADATETINRVVDFFAADQQQQIRLTLAGTLRGIVCQRLVPTIAGALRPCLEVLVNTGRVADRIADAKSTSEIREIIAQSSFYGMRTFDQSLLELVTSGEISIAEAKHAASVPHDLEIMLQQAGLDAPPSSGIEQPELEKRLNFADDVKPLFGSEERGRMLWAFDLWNHGSVRENATHILKLLQDREIPFEHEPLDGRDKILETWVKQGSA
jgi:twitching motility protein PilT